jgi:protein tyrosine/serine phosphatase
MKRPIKHVSRNVYRASRPDSVQELRDAGIDIVINLEEGLHELLTDGQYEIEKARELKILFLELDNSNLRPFGWKTASVLLEIIRDNPTKKILIHCAGGVDRTGRAVAVHRMQNDLWSVADAKREIICEGQNWFYRWHNWSLKQFEVKR